MSTVPLVRRRDERIIAGVCAGLAAHLRLPLMWVRVAMAALAAVGGAGVVLYGFLWVTVPWESPDEQPLFRRALTKPAESGAASAGGASAHSTPVSEAMSSAVEPEASVPGSAAPKSAASNAAASNVDRPGRPLPAAPGRAASDPSATGEPETGRTRGRIPVAELLLGAGLLIAGVAFAMVQFGAQLHLEVVLPAIAVLAGVGLAWWQIADRDRPDRSALPRVLGALVLVAVGVLMFFVTAREPNTFTVITAALAVLAGVALAAAPWLLRLNRELIAERAGREREAERAEIAAHLHDSVLQTLAAIQQRSEPGSEVARLARGQERELRDWLFRAADGAPGPPGESLSVELRAHAAALERVHAVRFEIVSVGAEAAIAPAAILGSAREAMVNAARHAGGDVSVYVEWSPSQVTVDITDRGPGFDARSIPEGRMGVRESIVGRMQRSGGSAKIDAGPGGTGTAVRLVLPRASEGTENAHA